MSADERLEEMVRRGAKACTTTGEWARLCLEGAGVSALLADLEALREDRDDWKERAILTRADFHRERERAEEAERELGLLLDEARDMRSYVPEYFAEKWHHDEALERASAFLAALSHQPEHPPSQTRQT